MPNHKQEHPLSFKVSAAMMAKIDEERETESRSQSDMAKILIAEALMTREGKRNLKKIL